MKRTTMGILTAVFVLITAVAFAGPWGMGGRYNINSDNQQKFLDDTKELRKQMHDLRFDLMELYRKPDANRKKIDAMEEQFEELSGKIAKKADEYRIDSGYGSGRGCDTPRGGYYRGCDGPRAGYGRNCGYGDDSRRGDVRPCDDYRVPGSCRSF